jgi:hypothetical protein
MDERAQIIQNHNASSHKTIRPLLRKQHKTQNSTVGFTLNTEYFSLDRCRVAAAAAFPPLLCLTHPQSHYLTRSLSLLFQPMFLAHPRLRLSFTPSRLSTKIYGEILQRPPITHYTTNSTLYPPLFYSYCALPLRLPPRRLPSTRL